MRLQILVLLLAFVAGMASAQEKRDLSGGDRLVAGGSVRQTVPVEGDLFGFAGDFELSAPVKGDAIIAGGNVRIRGPIGGELIVGGGNVVVSGAVARDVVIGGGNVEIAAEASVEGDLSAAGGDVDIRGPVKGSIHVGAGDVTIDAEVGGDVHAASGDLKLGPKARIAGRLIHRGGSISRDPAAQVEGGIERAIVSSGKRRDQRGDIRYHTGGVGGWFWTIGLIALAALLAGAFPAASKRVGAELRAHPGLAVLFGFVVLVCVPIAAAIFMITIIGIPVALIVLLLYFVLLLVGYASAGVMLGDAALERFRAADAAHVGWRIGAAVLAMLLLALLGRIPFLGGFIVFAALLLGMGAIVITYGRRQAAPAAA